MKISKGIFGLSFFSLALALSGCTGVSTTVKAPTNSATQAPVAQKDLVIGWASACEIYDNFKSGATNAVTDGVIPAKDYSVILNATKSTDPLCLSFPKDPASAATVLLTTVMNLKSTIPGVMTGVPTLTPSNITEIVDGAEVINATTGILMPNPNVSTSTSTTVTASTKS